MVSTDSSLLSRNDPDLGTLRRLVALCMAETRSSVCQSSFSALIFAAPSFAGVSDLVWSDENSNIAGGTLGDQEFCKCAWKIRPCVDTSVTYLGQRSDTELHVLVPVHD